MLTRLEVRGFKNLLETRAEFGPFTCIVGSNGVGKSNVLDAIEFLSHLASEPLVEASQLVRGSADTRGSEPRKRGGDVRDLFWDGYRDHEHRIDFAVEMIVPRQVEDDLGASATATTTFLRYELSLGYEAPAGAGSIGRPSLLREELRHINRGDAPRHLRFPHSVGSFRNAVLTGQRRGGAYLSTEEKENGTVINVHGDGGSRGRPQPRAVARAGRTVLSTVTTNDYPTILAARREMQSWRRFALEPSALRAPDDFSAPKILGDNGQHLAAALYRIAHDTTVPGTPDPAALYARVATRLSDLSGVRVADLSVEPDEARELFTLFLRERGDLRLPARALSEGTLRFLALCVLLEDPDFTGLLCMEEPENGIHPANLPAIMDLVRDLAVDATSAPDSDNPLRQVIVNTHAPGVVQRCERADLLLAGLQPTLLPDGTHARTLVLMPIRGSWRATDAVRVFSEADVMAYLASPADPQIQLPIDLVG